jgi:DNA-binding XRE family transcriptional regulator
MNTEEVYGLKELERDYGPLTFGRALEATRKCEELSQKEFALKLGISAQSLCDIEKGRSLPSVKRAMKIAKRLQESEKVWVTLAFQDMLRKENLNYKVSVG